jgi:regulator of replication initiation timing
MFAVREEIRTLKEEIDDLTRKNERLEYENGQLRSNISPEVLKRLGLDLGAANYEHQQ